MGKPEVIRLNVSEEKGEIRLGVRNGKAGLIAELCLELSEGKRLRKDSKTIMMQRSL